MTEGDDVLAFLGLTDAFRMQPLRFRHYNEKRFEQKNERVRDTEEIDPGDMHSTWIMRIKYPLQIIHRVAY